MFHRRVRFRFDIEDVARHPTIIVYRGTIFIQNYGLGSFSFQFNQRYRIDLQECSYLVFVQGEDPRLVHNRQWMTNYIQRQATCSLSSAE